MTAKHQWQRSLGPYKLISLVAGNMIGSGVFLLPSSLAKIGSISLLAWFISALGAMILALIFSRLSQLIPETGGPYAYVRATFGEFMGFQIAYAYWIAVWVGNTAITVALIGYLSLFWPTLLQSRMEELAVGLGAIWLFTGINLWGVRQSGTVQVIVTILKIVPLVLFAVIGIFFADFHHLTEFNLSGQSHFTALEMGITLTLWSFIGLESATVPAEHVINPKRTIPLATIAGTLIAAFVYILATAAVMGIIPMGELAVSNAPYAEAALSILGPYGRAFVGIAAIVTCLGSLNGWILLQGQVPFAAAEDGLFPKSFTRYNRSGSPYIGILVSSLLMTVLLILRFSQDLVDTFTFIIELATVITLLPYLFSTLAEILFYIQNPSNKPKRGFGFRLTLALVGFAYTYWALFGGSKTVIYYLAVLFFLGLPFYAWMKAEQSPSP